jgi:hypothetical protein
MSASLAAGIMLVSIATVRAADDARTILEQSVAAHGGLERFRLVHDWHISAEREIQGETGRERYDEYLLREGGLERTLLVKTREGSLLVFGHDGRRGFAVADGKIRTDEGAEDEGYYRAHGEYYLRSLPFKWMDPGVRVAYAGSETLDSREFDLLRFTAEENVGRAWNDVWVAVIDRKTRLLDQARLTHHREGGVTEIVYHYSDYRNVAGLQIAHRLEYSSGGRTTGENVIREIRIDAGVPESLFSSAAHQTR